MMLCHHQGTATHHHHVSALWHHRSVASAPIEYLLLHCGFLRSRPLLPAHLWLLLAAGNLAIFGKTSTSTKYWRATSTIFPSHTSYLHPLPSSSIAVVVLLPSSRRRMLSSSPPLAIAAHTPSSFPLPCVILATVGCNKGFNKHQRTLPLTGIYTHLLHGFQLVTICWQGHEEINSWKKVS